MVCCVRWSRYIFFSRIYFFIQILKNCFVWCLMRFKVKSVFGRCSQCHNRKHQSSLNRMEWWSYRIVRTKTFWPEKKSRTFKKFHNSDFMWFYKKQSDRPHSSSRYSSSRQKREKPPKSIQKKEIELCEKVGVMESRIEPIFILIFHNNFHKSEYTKTSPNPTQTPSDPMIVGINSIS